jgi:Kae1-associated kinase Bud32
MSNQKTLYQGAEAIITLDEKLNQIIKERIKKSYRISELDDQIRKRRTKSEAKILEKAGKVISTPKVIKVEDSSKKLIIEYINGKKLSEQLDSFDLNKQKQILKIIGEETAKLHNIDIIHGDLTTSNLILVEEPKTLKIYFIDFGLGFHSSKNEDKAVDLHLIKQALEAKHYKNWEVLFKEFEKSYSKTAKQGKLILERLSAVEKRGRYKH